MTDVKLVAPNGAAIVGTKELVPGRRAGEIRMSDLISREAVLQLLHRIRCSHTDHAPSGEANELTAIVDECADAVLAAPAITPQVVANISGGLLHGASSDYRVDIYAIDFEDVPDDDPESVILVEGDEVYLSQSSTEIDLEFVKSVVQAPTLADLAAGVEE